MLEAYESVSPTAILTSYQRTFTDIQYEKEIFDWLNKKCKDKIQLNKLTAPVIEARYKLANKLIDKQKIFQILELAAGYCSRGLIYSQKKYKYVEMDLESVANTKKQIINELLENGVVAILKI